jgi:hypothetical protein
MTVDECEIDPATEAGQYGFVQGKLYLATSSLEVIVEANYSHCGVRTITR